MDIMYYNKRGVSSKERINLNQFRDNDEDFNLFSKNEEESIISEIVNDIISEISSQIKLAKDEANEDNNLK